MSCFLLDCFRDWFSSLCRPGNTAAREHIRATFVPIIRKKITSKKERHKEEEPQSVCSWRPFQAISSERHPVITANERLKTLFPGQKRQVVKSKCPAKRELRKLRGGARSRLAPA